MKKLLSILLSIVILMTMTVYGASALDDSAMTEESTIVGDVFSDQEVDILDVLYLQLHFSHILTIEDTALALGDVDLDGTVDMTDATRIQYSIAKLDGGGYTGMTTEQASVQKQYDDAQLSQREKERQIINEIESFTRSKGVDISEFNGNVDMNQLKKQGYDFVIIRLGYGSDQTDQDDNMFETNVKKAEAAGLDWGAYIYSYALTVNEAKSEANHTLRMLRGKQPTMPIAFDWEDDNYKQRYGMPSNATVREIARTYVNTIYNAGYYPMIYTGYYWLKGAFDDDTLFEHCDIWLAQWSTKYDYRDRPLGMWQYGGETNYIESPTISGLSGIFDKNYSYKNYPMIIKAYGYNNHMPLLSSYASTGAYDDGIVPDNVKLPAECNGVMGDSLRNQY
ncbi:MAG: hypothetical protein IIZ32_05450 [Ruminococcus sp.]|nr:hypothetical protein [Ruminococcus sp.]